MRPRGVLLDLDGTLYEDARPVPGAADAVARLRDAGLRVGCVTNTTRVPRRALHARLRSMGFDFALDDVITAPRAAADWLRTRALGRVLLLLPRDTHEEFEGLVLTDANPDAVVVGDLGAAWTFDRLDTAFRAVLEGAKLVAIQKNRYWKSAGRLVLDAGPFVAALEYACDTAATVLGKPSEAFYGAAARALGLPISAVVMVGDDAASDAAAARKAGGRGVAVRTGKYRPGDEHQTDPAPNAVLDSVAQLPEWIAALR